MFPVITEEETKQETLTTNEEKKPETLMTEEGFTLVESPKDHNGIERIVVDEVLNEEQCQDLLQLTEVIC